MGAPSPFVLAEFGPGRGTLMADALRAARIRPRFREAARIHLVETSPRLRAIQERTLAGSAAEIAWASHIDELPRLPILIIANEFFDALPIRQFVATEHDWAERVIGLSPDGSLAFGLRPADGPGAATGNAFPDAPVGSCLEISPASTAIAAEIGRRVATDGGGALIIDYGHDRPVFGDTLQAVRGHAFADPLADPGEADLTAHVDFSALAASAGREGAIARRVIGQGAFLNSLGIGERAAALSKGKDDATRAAIAAAVERLTASAGMGTLFKVLALSHPGLALPVFDDDLA
jgi:NADH dehydrogenase [ubiquinone] 1 alpha subcomplex assembly factor 7